MTWNGGGTGALRELQYKALSWSGQVHRITARLINAA